MKAPTTALAAALCALAAASPAQEHVRHLRELGGEASEQAEKALVAMGAKAIPVLEEFVARWTLDEDDDAARLRAVLRVATLLGADAGPLAMPLQDLAIDLRNHDQNDLQLELSTLVASMQPYGRLEKWHELFHRLCHTFDDERRTTFFATMMRLLARNQVRGLGDPEQMMGLLQKDEYGAREVAAEELGRLGHTEAIEALHARLLDRERPADGGELRHNGFPVQLTDRFAWSASEALIALAPNDPRCAVAYAHRARLHPHDSARLAALMSLASLGPAAADAVPELLELAEGTDERLAAEALKVLGMAGAAAAPSLPRIVALTHRTDADDEPSLRARIADGLVARLGAIAPDAPTKAPAPEVRAALAARIAALGDDSEAAEIEALAREPDAFPLLVERFRKEREQTPEAVLALLPRLAWQHTEQDRYTLSLAATMVDGDCWQGQMMSTMTGGGGVIEPRFCELYGALHVDPAASVTDLLGYCDDENIAVRLAAVRRLAAAHERWAEGSEPFAATRDALLAAATTDHPDKCSFDYAGGSRQERSVRLDAPLHAAAAGALVQVPVPADKHPALLEAVLAHRDAALVAAAIERWGAAGTRAALERAAEDERASVQAAARAALERLDG